MSIDASFGVLAKFLGLDILCDNFGFGMMLHCIGACMARLRI
jgi:hypothetical protein